MLRKHDLVERLGTPLNSNDSPTERLQSFVNYLADNYNANEEGDVSIAEAIFIARKQIGEGNFTKASGHYEQCRKPKRNTAAIDGF